MGRKKTLPAPKGRVTVLVHGLWMNAAFMRIMSKMLEAKGFRTKTISYDFLKCSPAENAQALYTQIRELDAVEVNLVGHSLGGIVILHLLHQFPDLSVGKVVLIGSPVRGSYVARRVHDAELLRPLLGRSIEQGLLGGAPTFLKRCPLGIITGTGRLGISSLLYPTGDDSDGVVRASETLIEAANDRVSLPLSHSALIFSRRCADYVAHFLTTNRFKP